MNQSYGVPLDRISIIPLSPRIPIIDQYPEKEDFCFHLSSLADGRKNVMRLVQAAIKYHFKLVLAGSVNSDAAFSPIKSLIDTHDNISYLGRVPDAELYHLYARSQGVCTSQHQ